MNSGARMPQAKMSPTRQGRHQDAHRRKVRVRCLGVGREYTFLSLDPTRNRVCERCQKIMREIGCKRGSLPGVTGCDVD